MRSLELGTQAIRYTLNTAKEFSGIGRAQRAYKQEMSVGRAEALFYGAVNGVLSVAMPLSVKSIEDKKLFGPGFVIDLGVNVLALNFLGEGNIQAAFIAKVGYNTLVQIAPDVAKLAKNKFQRAK